MASDNVVPFPDRGVTIGGPVDAVGVSLAIYGELRGHALDPDEITAILGVAPTRSRRRGESLRPGRPPHRYGMWLLTVEPCAGADAADVAFSRLLDPLPSDPATWEGLRARYEIRFYVFVSFQGFNRGFSLSARSVARASLVGAGIEFDLYAGDRFPPELDHMLTP